MKVRNKLKRSRLLMKLISDNRHGLRCLHHKYLLLTCDIDTRRNSQRLMSAPQREEVLSPEELLESLDIDPPFEAAKELFSDIQLFRQNQDED